MATAPTRLLLLVAALALVKAPCLADAPPGPPNMKAPDAFQVELDTSRGPVTIEVTRANAPFGVDRFYNMVASGYLKGARFFRVVPGFVVQFGLSGDPTLNKLWDSPIKDDPFRSHNSNSRGTVVFARTSDPNSRTTQLFINLANNLGLDSEGFTPIGRVTQGMVYVDSLFSGYGEDPDQGLIITQGDAYLMKNFPSLDYIKAVRVVPLDNPARK
jgi:peptidyl-prolyl cis-trans isomerase A (cyclophilin A)